MAVASVSILGILLLFGGLLLVGGIVLVVFLLTQKPSDNVVISNDSNHDRSYFDGNTLEHIGWSILSGLITTFTLGIAFPWATCMLERWRAKHTVINGRRLRFTGTGAQLFGNFILWYILTVITCGIYSIWFGLGLEKWKVKHTVFADGDNPVESRFTAGAGGWFGYHLLAALISGLTCGLGFAFAQKMLISWRLRHTEVGGAVLTFDGTGLGLLGKYLLGGLLTGITCGIYGLFFPVSLIKWEVSHTFALYRTEKYRKMARSHEEEANKDFAKFKLAANNAELDILKGDSSEENPSIYTLYAKSKEGAEDSLELLRQAADGGYHPAAFEYAFNGGDTLKYLEISAKGGNPTAPWLLAKEYKNLALRFGFDTPAGLQNLKTSAYWHKIAIEQEHPDAVASVNEYNDILEKIALFSARLDAPQTKSSGAGIIIVGVIAAVFILLAALGVGAIVLGMPVLRFGGNEAIAERPYVEDYTGSDYTVAFNELTNKGITVKKIDVYSNSHPANEVIKQDFIGEGYVDEMTIHVAKPFDLNYLDGCWASVYLDEEGLYILREIYFQEDGTLSIRTLPMQKFEDGNGWHNYGGSEDGFGTYSISGNEITMDIVFSLHDEDGDFYEKEETKVFVLDSLWFYEDEKGDNHGIMELNKDYYDGKYSMYFVELDYNYDEMIEIMEENR